MGGLDWGPEAIKELAMLPSPELHKVLQGLSCLWEWPPVTYTADIHVSFNPDPVIYKNKAKLGLSLES